MLASTSLVALTALLGIDIGRLFGPSFLGGGLLFYVVAAFSLMKVAERSDARDQAVTAWIPILNVLLMLRIARKPMWWILLFLVPVLNFFMWIFLCLGLAKARGASFFTGLLMAFVPILGFPLLALSES